jgi:hypothetical protein
VDVEHTPTRERCFASSQNVVKRSSYAAICKIARVLDIGMKGINKRKKWETRDNKENKLKERQNNKEERRKSIKRQKYGEGLNKKE